MTKGLNYLHSIEVVHGDLKSVSFPFHPPTIPLAEHEIQSNVLIDPNGNPRLTDFGFSSITMDDFSANASTPNGKGSTRWRAPELLELSIKVKNREKSKPVRPTNESDVYSLAMLVIEVTPPFFAENPVARPYQDLRYSRGSVRSTFTVMNRWFSCSHRTCDQRSQSTHNLPRKCGLSRRSAGIRIPINGLTQRKSWGNLSLEPGAVHFHSSFKFFWLLMSRAGRNQYGSLAASLSAFFNSRISLQFAGKSDAIQ